jgi:hypothetical protein
MQPGDNRDVSLVLADLVAGLRGMHSEAAEFAMRSGGRVVQGALPELSRVPILRMAPLELIRNHRLSFPTDHDHL